MSKPHPAAAYLVESLAEMARAIAAARDGNVRAASAHAKAAALWVATLGVATASLAAAEIAAGQSAPFVREAFRIFVERGMAEHHASMRCDADAN